MMRVAVLSPAAELGGAERSLLAFLKSSRSRGIEAVVVLPREGRLTEALTVLGVPWHIVTPPQALLTLSRGAGAGEIAQLVRQSPQAGAYLLRVARLLGDLSPHVIYTNGIKGHILGAMLRPVVRKPVVWHVRDVWGGQAMGLMADLGADRVIANSRATAASLEEHMRQPRKVTVVHNAVDTDEFRPEGAIASVGPGELRVGLPGMMAGIKGHELLLRAAAVVSGEFPSTRYYFIGGAAYDTSGDGGCEAELRAAVGRSGLQGRVVFTGFQERMAPWYRAMDVVVNASIRPEGFGRTVLEAMSCGRAVVAPDAGGIREFVRHGHNGLLYRMGDCDGLAQAVLSLLRRPALRQQLGKAGRETAVGQFSLERYVDGVCDILKSARAPRVAPLQVTAPHPLRKE